MNVPQLRSQRYRVQTGDLLDEQTALQAAMGGFNYRVLAVEFPVDLHQPPAQGGIPLVLPAWVAAPLLRRAAAALHNCPHPLAQHCLLRGDAGAQGERKPQPLLLHFHNAQVQRGLHQAGKVHIHGLNSLGQGQQRPQAPVCILGGQRCFHRRLFTRQRNTLITAGVFIFENPAELRDKALKLSLFPRGNGDPGLVKGADDIVKFPTPDLRNPQARDLLHGAVQHPAHQLVGGGTALVNVRTGVSPLKTGDGHGIARLPCQRPLRTGQQTVHPKAAGAGDGKYPLLLRVQIQKLAALEIGAVQSKGPIHANLLVHSEHRLQRRVRHGPIRQNRQGHGYGNAVISPQGGLLRPDILSVGGQVQPLPGHVLAAVLRLGANHVHVALENHGSRVLITGSAVLPDHHVIEFVLPPLETQLLGKPHAQVADDLCVAATVRHRAQLFKILKYRLGFQV